MKTLYYISVGIIIMILFPLILKILTTTKNETGDSMNKKEIIKIIIAEERFEVALESNTTVTEFLELLPLTITMNELNGNEKFTYLNQDLTTNSKHYSTINKGDIMLFGSNCLVLFYESFSTSYQYTKIGTITDTSNLSNITRSSNISVKISM